MPKTQTLITKATALNTLYPSEPNSPQKNKVTTNGEKYHGRLNSAHQVLLDEKTMTEKAIGSTNFLTAELVFVIQTKAKRIPISFPVFTGENVYNYQNVPISDEGFKKFLAQARDKTTRILRAANLNLDISTNYINACPSYYCQKAYHTEKFFFYYLNTVGLKNIINLFPTKSITPDTLVSIDAVELRMHSTRDMCHTCESLSIAEKDSLQVKLNELLLAKQYPALPHDFKSKVIMSFTNQSSERAGKTQANANTINITSTRLPAPKVNSSEARMNLDGYTCFTSGGSNESDQNRRAIHLNAATNTKSLATQATAKIESKAAKKIQNSFRRHIARRATSTLKSLYNSTNPLKNGVLKKTSEYIIKTALSISKILSKPIKSKSIANSKANISLRTIPSTIAIPVDSKVKPRITIPARKPNSVIEPRKVNKP